MSVDKDGYIHIKNGKYRRMITPCGGVYPNSQDYIFEKDVSMSVYRTKKRQVILYSNMWQFKYYMDTKYISYKNMTYSNNYGYHRIGRPAIITLKYLSF